MWMQHVIALQHRLEAFWPCLSDNHDRAPANRSESQRSDLVNRSSGCSAADLYIKDYIDPLVVGGRHPEAVPLRVVYRHRWTQAIHPTVLKYCLLNADNAVPGAFRMPSADAVRRHRLVVATLSTSRYLCDLELGQGTARTRVHEYPTLLLGRVAANWISPPPPRSYLKKKYKGFSCH